MPEKKSKKSHKSCKHLKTKIISETSEGIGYGYCLNCAGIFLIKDGKNIFTVKPKLYQEPIDFDPIEMVRVMRRRELDQYPYNLDEVDNKIGLGFNSSSAESDYSEEDDKDKEKKFKLKKLKDFTFDENILDRYLRKRKNLLSFVQKVTLQQKFGDATFYLALFFIDNFLSRNIAKNSDKKELLLIALGFLVVAAKFGESNIFEPEFSELVEVCHEYTDITLDEDILAKYEFLCLGFLKFDLMCYSAYDWLMAFMMNGFVFKEEIDSNENSKKVISQIYTHCTKILATITGNKLFIKYPPEYIALSIIKLARKDLTKEGTKKDKEKSKGSSKDNSINLITSSDEFFYSLLKLYGYRPSEFKKCYKDIKELLNVPESPKKKRPKRNNTVSLSEKNVNKEGKFGLVLESEEDIEKRDTVDELLDYRNNKNRGSSTKNMLNLNNELLNSQQLPSRYQSGKNLELGMNNKLGNSLIMSKFTKIDSHVYIDAAPEKGLKTEAGDTGKPMNPNLNPRTKFEKQRKSNANNNAFNSYSASSKQVTKGRFSLNQSTGISLFDTSGKKRISENNIPISINPVKLSEYQEFGIAEEVYSDVEEHEEDTRIFSELEGSELTEFQHNTRYAKNKRSESKKRNVDNRGNADQGTMFENQHEKRNRKKYFGTKIEDSELPNQINKKSIEVYGPNNKKRAVSLSKIANMNNGKLVNRLKTISSEKDYIKNEMKRKSTSNSKLLKIKLNVDNIK